MRRERLEIWGVVPKLPGMLSSFGVEFVDGGIGFRVNSDLDSLIEHLEMFVCPDYLVPRVRGSCNHLLHSNDRS